MNESKAEGFFDQAKGKIKQAIGETTDDQSLANSGAADEVKGQAKETWGSVKDAAHESTTRTSTEADAHVQNTGHTIREDITSAAEHAKEGIQHGLDHLKEKS